MLAHRTRDCDAFCDHQSYGIDRYGDITGSIAICNRARRVMFGHGGEHFGPADEIDLFNVCTRATVAEALLFEGG
jgi:hypothetical protein